MTDTRLLGTLDNNQTLADSNGAATTLLQRTTMSNIEYASEQQKRPNLPKEELEMV
jgi:hypothetical protein